MSRLDDKLFAQAAAPIFSEPAKSYLDDWSAPDVGWLRKFYPEGSDEPYLDAIPAVEMALSWIETLQERSFVGAESRLNTIFTLVRQMVHGAETYPDVRLAELRQRRCGTGRSHADRILCWRNRRWAAAHLKEQSHGREHDHGRADRRRSRSRGAAAE